MRTNERELKCQTPLLAAHDSLKKYNNENSRGLLLFVMRENVPYDSFAVLAIELFALLISGGPPKLICELVFDTI